jgi:predicted HicB family RNase H-like nuclease
LPVNLIEALNEWAKEEGVSRNTLVGRELATAVTRRGKPG